MDSKKVIIGYVTLPKDTEMHNNQFEYAASFEHLLVPAGKYPIYAYAKDLDRSRGYVRLGWRNYVGYEGTVIASNVGGKPGEKTGYHLMTQDYILADAFFNGHDACLHYLDRREYELRPEWTIKVHDFVSSFDGKRVFMAEVVLKDGAELEYM